MADSGGEKGIIAENKAGAAPSGDALRHSRPSSVNKGRRRPRPVSVDATPVNAHTLHWFAYLGPDPEAQIVPETQQPIQEAGLEPNNLSDGENEDVRRSTNFDAENYEQGGSGNRAPTEERLRHVRDRQQEERQRRLEELRAQALAAQKFREQKEEERRKRIEEMRLRDNDRRSQVEERKKAIWEADRDRREAILRKNQEREARIETKRKNDRSNIVFAFGSSTPRMLEPADTGGSFWGHRRATSTTNVTFTAAPLTRRSSERELDGSKKRATSAGGLDRQPGEDDQADATGMPVVYQRTVVRRRTDLVPTIPSPRETANLHGSRSSLSHGRSSGAGGRAYSMTRLDQLAKPRRPQLSLLSTSTNTSPNAKSPTSPGKSSSRSRSMMHLAGAGLPGRKVHAAKSMTQLAAAGGGGSGPIPPPRMTRAERLRRQSKEGSGQSAGVTNGGSAPGLRSGEMTPSQSGSSSRPGSSLSQQNGSPGAGLVTRRPVSAPRRPRPASIAVTGVSAEEAAKNSRHNVNGDRPKSIVDKEGSSKPPLPKVHAAPRKSVPSKPETPKRTATEKVSRPSSVKASPRITPKATPLQSPGADNANTMLKQSIEETSNKSEMVTSKIDTASNSETNQHQQEPAATATLVETSTEQIATVSGPADGKDAIAPQGESLQTSDKPVESPKVVAESAKIVETNKNTVETNAPTREEQKPAVETPAVAPPQQKVESVKPEEKTSDTLAPTENGESADMTASMIAKIRITTEEEAKAALAERRRLAREEAERQAEAERRRQQEAEEAELKRQREEEEHQRLLEQETLRLAAEQRLAEEQRLLQAIEETRQREEEEARRREEEAKQKAEKEEQEKKAREEAERQREEMAKRLEQEEKEREARRKRVEAIMLRTRSKAGGANQGNSNNASPSSKAENEDKSPSEDTPKTDKEQESDSNQSAVSENAQETFEKSVTDKENALFNSTMTKNPLTVTNNGFQSDVVNKNNNQLNGENVFKNDNENENEKHSNGHRNGPDLIDNTVEQNNTTNTLLDLSEFDNLDNSTTTVTNLKNAMQMPHGDLITDMMTGVDQIIDLVDATNSNTTGQNGSQNTMPTPIIAFTDNSDNRDLSLL